ncbi:MAG: class II glutamine amidotransferase [Rubripirellula sp.]
MCRWIAYSGSPILLEELIVKPQHSLVEQSLTSRQGAETTNGDGFGVGWYGETVQPGLYRETDPAWNDRNLADLTRHIRSSMFLAHVRATTGTPIQRTNCHPFRYQNWLFVHNGFIANYGQLRRDLAFRIAPELYPLIEGTTDSELMFHLALTFGLNEEPLPALERMAGFVESIGRAHKVELPLQMTLGLSDGERLYAIRYSTEHKSRTLYHSKSVNALRAVHPQFDRLSTDSRSIVSEPLTDLTADWAEIPESTAVIVDAGDVTQHGFHPRPTV